MMDVIKRNFGESLKNIRKLREYTQEQLAELIGINLRQLARIEAGESFVTSETIFKLCKVLEVSPWEFFNFDIQPECLMTGTGKVVHLNVIKDGNINHIVSKHIFQNTSSQQNKQDDYADFDKRMIALAKSLKKEIIVDEIRDGKIISTKKYKQDGRIETQENSTANAFENLIKKINKIANDRDKITFIGLAFDAITSRSALEELKIFIKGIELTQNNA